MSARLFTTPLRRGRMLGALLLVLAVIAGCSGTSKPKPTPLESIAPQVSIDAVWQQRVGRVSFPLRVAVGDGTFTVADDGGTVAAFAAADGRSLWRIDLGQRLAAGVGSDGRRAAVVTQDNELIVVDGGAVAWRTRLASRVSAPPFVAGGRVFVMGVDRIVLAFDAIDGRPLWRLQRPGDALMLSEAGVIGAYHDTLLVGQGPRLAGVDPLRGELRWEVAVATPRGTNEVERLADLVGPAARLGSLYCVRAFQSAVGCVDAERQAIQWTRNASGWRGVAADTEVVVGADATSRITAWRTANGDVAWSSERLLYRDLGPAGAFGPHIVFGDFEGQLHFLSSVDGHPQLRLPTDGSAIAVPSVVADDTLLVVTGKGGVYAFRRR